MRRVSKRGQASAEYLIVSSLTLLIVIPAVFAFFQYSNTKTLEIEENQILRLGSRISIETENTYFGGKDTKITITERFPSILHNITFIPYKDGRQGGEYVLYYNNQKAGNLMQSIGYPVNVNVSLDTANTFWNPGARNIVFVAQQNAMGKLYVNMTVQ